MFVRRLRLLFLYAILACGVLSLTGCDWFDDDDDDVATTSGSASAVTTPAPVAAQSISGKGIIWKPVSDANRLLVVILPDSSKPTVQITKTDGTVIETGYRNGKHSGRTVYRFKRPGKGYPAPVLLKINKTYFKIPNPGRRWD